MPRTTSPDNVVRLDRNLWFQGKFTGPDLNMVEDLRRDLESLHQHPVLIDRYETDRGDEVISLELAEIEYAGYDVLCIISKVGNTYVARHPDEFGWSCRGEGLYPV